jgi:hypothetical protein
MIFGKSTKPGEEEDMGATSKTAYPKYSMPRWCPSGLTRSRKHKLQRLRAKESKEKEAEKYLMIHIRSTHHHEKGGNQMPSKQIKRTQKYKTRQHLHNSLQVR